MGLKVYGIGAAENVDNSGETLKISGLDDSRMNLIRDEHSEDSFFHKIGAVTYHKKIFGERDCENEKQKRCWQFAQVPFLYAEAEFADDTDHPNAKSAVELIKFTSRPDISKTLSIGWSIDGGIVEKQNNSGQSDENGKILARTVGTALALTHKPCNPKCRIFLENDLTKSDLNLPPPQRYWKALKQDISKASLNQVDQKEFQIFLKLNKLKKSLADFHGGFTSLKCKKCGHGVRFFKSGDTPNGCSNCRSNFSMSEVWQALNK